MSNAALPGLQHVKQAWIQTTEAEVRIRALRVDVTRRVYLGPERRTSDPGGDGFMRLHEW